MATLFGKQERMLPVLQGVYAQRLFINGTSVETVLSNRTRQTFEGR